MTDHTCCPLVLLPPANDLCAKTCFDQGFPFAGTQCESDVVFSIQLQDKILTLSLGRWDPQTEANAVRFRSFPARSSAAERADLSALPSILQTAATTSRRRLRPTATQSAPETRPSCAEDRECPRLATNLPMPGTDRDLCCFQVRAHCRQVYCDCCDAADRRMVVHGLLHRLVVRPNAHQLLPGRHPQPESVPPRQPLSTCSSSDLSLTRSTWLLQRSRRARPSARPRGSPSPEPSVSPSAASAVRAMN